MRGKAVRCAVRKSCRRITPAYAGKSLPSLPPAGTAEDHPRLCGEKFSFRVPPFWAVGSPPPMRGKGTDSYYTPPFSGDHPRLCGEKSRLGVVSSVSSGSPPPMRGKVSDPVEENHFLKDHPRLCGEKFTDSPLALAGKGSPPPMRGKGLKLKSFERTNRITPAYAGKSALSASGGVHRRDHPRLCGEKRKLSRLLIFSLGSPPPMRGKGSTEDRLIVFYRITPAYAGKRVCLAPVRLLVRDHPRLCGEKEVT